MSVALKAVAWAWKFTQTVKRLAGFHGTSKLQLPVPLEPSESWLPSVQSTGKLFYCLYDKNFVPILICELSIWNFLQILQILENYVTYNL